MMDGPMVSSLFRKVYPASAWPRRTCRQVTALVLRNEDRALPWHERLAVRLHLRACEACPRFLRQVKLMSQAMGRWRAYAQEERD